MDVMRMLVIVAAVLAIGGVAVAATNRGTTGATGGAQVSSLTLNEKLPMAGMSRKLTLTHGSAFQRMARMVPIPLPQSRKVSAFQCGVCPLDVLTVKLSTGVTRMYHQVTAPQAITTVIKQMRKMLPPASDTQPAP
jgi:hypothetical protein